MSTQVFLPTISLAGMPVEYAFERIKKAGFHGTEMIITHRNRARASYFRELAVKNNLGLHWHQPWSYTENTTHWYNFLAKWLGMLEPDGYALKDILPKNRVEPVVVYADRWEEALGNPLMWLQTCTVMNGEGKHKLSFEEFKKIVQMYEPRLVFDTQHYLEWRFGCLGVGGLPTDRAELRDALLEGWQEFGHLVEEIHVNDFDPRRGNSGGRNLLIGDGIAPLEPFASSVYKSGWGGVVIPEVSPIRLFPYRHVTLKRLLYDVAGLFT